MEMAGSKVDTNFKNPTFREHFSHKQKFKANSDLLFHAVSDSKLSEHFDHNKDTVHANKEKRNIYSSRIKENKGQIGNAVMPNVGDEGTRKNDSSATSRQVKLYFIILAVIGCISVATSIGFGLYFCFKSKEDPTVKRSPTSDKEDPITDKQAAKVQQKCKEYTDLACSLKPSDNYELSSIVHGNKVPRGMLPHQAFLLIRTQDQNDSSQCGGALINEKFVLTSAHCVLDAWLGGQIKVQLGRLTIDTDDEDTNPEVWKKVKKVHVHPEYNFTKKTFESDICLLELENNVIFSSDVRPICLNTKYGKMYDMMIASGWGITEDGYTSDYLRMVELYVSNEDEICRNELGTQYDAVNKIGICLAQHNHSTGGGDSGGPLQVKLKSNCKNTWELIGITARGKRAVKDNEVTIQLFVKVECHISWIASVVWPD